MAALLVCAQANRDDDDLVVGGAQRLDLLLEELLPHLIGEEVGQQEQAATEAQPQQNDAEGDAWQSPLQWNDVIGGGAQGTGPRQDV